MSQIYKRYNFNGEVLQKLELIDPDVIVTAEKPSILPLALLFHNLIDQNDLQSLDTEYREIKNLEFKTFFTEVP